MPHSWRMHATRRNYIWIAGHGRCIYYWICWVMLYDVPLKLHANSFVTSWNAWALLNIKHGISICWAKRICSSVCPSTSSRRDAYHTSRYCFKLLGFQPLLVIDHDDMPDFYHGDTNIKHWHYIKIPSSPEQKLVLSLVLVVLVSAYVLTDGGRPAGSSLSQAASAFHSLGTSYAGEKAEACPFQRSCNTM